MGFEADRRHDGDGWYIYPQPGRINPMWLQLDGDPPTTASEGSFFDWKASFEFPDLGEVGDITERREEIRQRVRAGVEEMLRNEVNGGADFPHDLDGDAEACGWIYAKDVRQETELDVHDGVVSASQQVDLRVYLWHDRGQDPKAVLGKTVDQISDVVANTILEEIDQLEAEEEAVF